MTDALNVLLVVVDSLRYDAVFGDWDVETPNLDRIAGEGVVFTQCISQGVSTAPAMTAMLTGRRPLDYGGHTVLDAGQATFADAFRANGYATGAVHSNPYVSARRNFDRGFETFAERVVAFEPDRRVAQVSDVLARLGNRIARLVRKRPYTPASQVNDTALEFIDRVERPWFCWAHYMDAHGPYLPEDASYREKYRSEWLWRKAAVRDPAGVTASEHAELRATYASEVAGVDRAVGALLDALASRGVLEETIVVVTADHGEEFGEHGRYGHGNLPYDELIHVPLLVRFPESGDASAGGRTVDRQVRSMDILPTVIEYLGLERPAALTHRLVGTPRLVCDDGASADDVAFAEKRVRNEDVLRIGIRTEAWKYLWDERDDATHLFDLRSDPGEQHDLSSSPPPECPEFEALLRERLDRIKATADAAAEQDVAVPAGVEDQLRALGYKE